MNTIYDALYVQTALLLGVLPAILKALLILLVGYLLARIVQRVLKRLLKAIRIDALANRLRSIDLLAASKIDLVPSSAIASLAYYFIMVIFIMAAVEAMGLELISELLRDLIAYIPSALTALVVLVVGLIIADAVKKLIYETCRGLGIQSGNLIANAIFYFILLNIVLIALRQAQLQTRFMEQNITVILAGVAGAFAIGYGLAARKIMGSLLASFYNRGKFKVGDEVTIAGMRGEIITMNNSDLVLRAENSEYVIPFSTLNSEPVEIHSRRAAGPPLPPNQGVRK